MQWSSSFALIVAVTALCALLRLNISRRGSSFACLTPHLLFLLSATPQVHPCVQNSFVPGKCQSHLCISHLFYRQNHTLPANWKMSEEFRTITECYFLSNEWILWIIQADKAQQQRLLKLPLQSYKRKMQNHLHLKKKKKRSNGHLNTYLLNTALIL